MSEKSGGEKNREFAPGGAGFLQTTTMTIPRNILHHRLRDLAPTTPDRQQDPRLCNNCLGSFMHTPPNPLLAHFNPFAILEHFPSSSAGCTGEGVRAKSPEFEDLDFDNVQDHTGDEGDTKDCEGLSGGDGGGEPSKDDHQQCDDLGTKDHEREPDTWHALPKVSRQPRRENKEMGSRGDVEVHDRFKGPVDFGGVAFCSWVRVVTMDFPKVEEVAKGKTSEEDAKEAGEEN